MGDTSYSLSSRDLRRLSAEYDRLSGTVARRSAGVVQDLQVREARLSQRLEKADSGAATAVFSDAAAYYQRLRSGLRVDGGTLPLHPLKEYLPKMDSLQTALQFLNLQRLNGDNPGAIGNLLEKVKVLQAQLEKANGISAMVSLRQQQLQSALAKYNLSGYLSGYSQTAYYYKAQIEQYKEVLGQPDKLAGKILLIVRNSAAFQRYFRNHSYLASLFRVPGGSEALGKPVNGALQTRAQVGAIVAARLGKGANFASAASGQSTGGSTANPLAGGMGDAQSAMNAVKSKIARWGGGSSSAPVPDFQPNPQHNKSLWKRLEVGFNLQSTHTTPLLPATTDVAATLGYKASDRFVFGVGVGYKLGWGTPFSHLSLSGQGASLRSYLNWKIKGSWWLAGGYEANYYNAFSRLDQLAPLQAWQPSGLIGVQKTYKAGKRTGNIQLLYNFLYQNEIPQPQPLIFRVGYTL